MAHRYLALLPEPRRAALQTPGHRLPDWETRVVQRRQTGRGWAMQGQDWQNAPVCLPDVRHDAPGCAARRSRVALAAHRAGRPQLQKLSLAIGRPLIAEHVPCAG